jgi:hypothetical protein
MRADGIEESTMPKKDTAAAVIGMLSTAGAQTRLAADDAERAEQPPAAPSVTVTEDAPASVTTLPTPALPTAAAPEAPRTLRLRPSTAQRVRQAWLEAKRVAHRPGFRFRPCRRGAGAAPAVAHN